MNGHERTSFPIEGIESDHIASFLVEALATMRHHHELADLCALLTTRLGTMLPIAAAAVVLTDGIHGPAVASATGTSVVHRRTLEDHLDSDVVRRCLDSGDSTSSIDQSGDAVSVHALPVGSDGIFHGALVLVSEVPLTSQHLAVAGIFVDVATVAFLRVGPHLESASSQARFTDLLHSLDAIEQAKGMLSQRHGVGVDAAFEGMWEVAVDHGIGLGAFAAGVVNRNLDRDMLRALESTLTNRASAPAE